MLPSKLQLINFGVFLMILSKFRRFMLGIWELGVELRISGSSLWKLGTRLGNCVKKETVINEYTREDFTHEYTLLVFQ